MTLLCCYTLLLAASAWLVIRLGKVWDDARTILLVIVLMFFALAISFDQSVLNNYHTGAVLLAAGLTFSILVTESLLWSLGIRLNAWHRLPYHAMLALLFLYPLWLGRLIHGHYLMDASWSVFAFPWIAAALFLTLLIAARQGSDGAANNGTPWMWPLYPWVAVLHVVRGRVRPSVVFGGFI